MTHGPHQPIRGTAPTVAHFDAIAASWRRSSDVLGAFTAPLLDALGPLAPETTLLDIACGAGEPGVSAAVANPGTSLWGVDLAPNMVEQAREEAASRGLVDARFDVMAAESLDIDDSAIDAIVSRLGLLALPGATAAAAHEAARVLRPHGRLAFATWGRTIENTMVHVLARVVADVVGPGAVDLSWMDELADGRREGWLREAGFTDVRSTAITWTVHEDDLEQLWNRGVGGGPTAPAFATLEDAGLARARERLAVLAQDFTTAEGGYAFPMGGRIVIADRAGR